MTQFNVKRRTLLALPFAVLAAACGGTTSAQFDEIGSAGDAGSGYPTDSVVVEPEIEELIELWPVSPKGFGDSNVNTAILRTDCPASDLVNKLQYMGWHSQDRTLILAKRELSETTWTVDVSEVTPTKAYDGHNFVSMGVDGSGRLHVCADMHGVEMNYWRGKGPGDIHIQKWFETPISKGSLLEESVTYPTFIPLGNGDLIFFFRNGGSGNGSLVLYHWRDASNGGDDQWHVLHTNLVDGEGLRSFYPNRIILDRARGRLHICGCWRETTYMNTNHDQIHFYLELSTNFKTAKRMDGSNQVLPVTQANAGYTQKIPQNSGLINTGGMTTFDDGRPISVVYRDPGNGISQFSLEYWDDETQAWIQRWVPGASNQQEPQPFSLVGLTDTIPYFAISSAEVVHRKGRTILIFKSDARGPGVWAWICEEPTLKHWTLKHLHNTDINEWAPSIDHEQWRENGEIFLFHQKAIRPGAPLIGEQPVSVLHWRPQSRPYGYQAPATPWSPDSLPNCVCYVNACVEGVDVVGTLGKNRDKCTSILDLRTHEAMYTATVQGCPTYVYNAFMDHGGLRFTRATADKLDSTDERCLTAYAGVNRPFDFLWIGRFETLGENDCLFSFGGSTASYMFGAVGLDGSLRFERRTGGLPVVAKSGTGVINTGETYAIRFRFDGLTFQAWVNGVEAIAPVRMDTSGSMTLTAACLGARTRGTTHDFYGDLTCGAFVARSAAVDIMSGHVSASVLAMEFHLNLV